MALPSLRMIGWSALALGVATLGGWYAVGGWHPSDADFAFQGVDVTADSGVIDWPTLKANGADFGYARATSGTTMRDPRFGEYWAGMGEAGVRRGAVHHFLLCADADQQAANFIRTVPRAADSLPAAAELTLDDQPVGCTPASAEAVRRDIAAFVAAVETHTGTPMLLKLTRAFENRYQVSATLHRPLWSSQMIVRPDYATRPWRMWQANPMRRIEGAEGNVGWDVVAP